MQADDVNSGKDGAAERKPEVDPRLLELLVCPVTKTSLDYDAVQQELISRVARLAFPIRDGVPMMTDPTAGIAIRPCTPSNRSPAARHLQYEFAFRHREPAGPP
jgi:uncharacterized protein